MPHIYQPNDYSCGPTCIKMLAETPLSIDELCEVCMTDHTVGTPPERMIWGLERSGLLYTLYVPPAGSHYTQLHNALERGERCILRTITQGIPHWTICHRYGPEHYQIWDPWLGILEYTEEYLESIWSPRQYLFFAIAPGAASSQ